MEISFLDDLENKVQSLITLLETTRQENSELKKELSEQRDTLTEIESQNSQMKQELDTLKNSSDEQQGKLASVTERIQGIISQLDSVNWSNGWHGRLGDGMNSTLASVRVNIFGSEYVIKSDVDSETTMEIAHYVNSNMANIQKSSAYRDHMKIAVLSAMNIAGEFFETKERCNEQEQKIRELQHRIDTLTQKVSSVLTWTYDKRTIDSHIYSLLINGLLLVSGYFTFYTLENPVLMFLIITVHI